MTTYFVTRHEGAIEWAEAEGIKAIHIPHLDPAAIQQGDVVLGTLPVPLIASICKRGARYLHLSMDIPQEFRGQHLSPAQMQIFGATLQEYIVTEVK